jgi:hypothetical protein
VKSFVAALKEGAMARRIPPQQRISKRHADYEEWMEEDNLLGLDHHREQDLLHKLQRGGDREGSSRDPHYEVREREHRLSSSSREAPGSLTLPALTAIPWVEIRVGGDHRVRARSHHLKLPRKFRNLRGQANTVKVINLLENSKCFHCTEIGGVHERPGLLQV